MDEARKLELITLMIEQNNMILQFNMMLFDYIAPEQEQEAEAGDPAIVTIVKPKAH